jgi:site-specific DNA recombinase
MELVDSLFEDWIYGRISEDDVGVERNVQRQLRACRIKSERHGGRLAGEEYDNDISALKGAPRPGFERLMAALTAPNPERGKRRIVVQHTSRLWRNRTERAMGIDALGPLGIIILQIDGPELDLGTAQGRMLAGMLGEVDTGESETKAERIRAAVVERAQEGRANGAVQYGWSRVYQYDVRGKVVGFEDTVDEAEAAIVREIVGRLLSGDSLNGITEDLNRRGVPAPNAGHRRKQRAAYQSDDGAVWGKSSVRKIALRPANIGLRVFHRGRDDEELLPAAWPAIVEFADHDRVSTLLTDPSRGTIRPANRRHLLTLGIGECGLCGGRLRTAPKGNGKYGRKILYVCEASHVARNLDSVNEYVSKVMIGLLEREESLTLLEGTSSLATAAMKRAAEHRARLDQAARDYADGLIESGQLRTITSRLKPQIEEAEAQSARHRTNPYAAFAASMIGDKARERWEALTVLQQRSLLQAFGVRVIIDRTRQGRGFDPTSVRIIPRGFNGE